MTQYFSAGSVLILSLLLSGCVAVGVAAVGGAVIGYGVSHMPKRQHASDDTNTSASHMSSDDEQNK